MANKQIGWSQESNLLWELIKEVKLLRKEFHNNNNLTTTTTTVA